MRSLLLFFTLIILSLTVFSQKKQTDLEFEGLKGKVKSVRRSSMYLGTKDEPVVKPERFYGRIEFYNSDGNLFEEHDPKYGIKYVYQFVDGYLSMKEVLVDRQKDSTIMPEGSAGNAETMEKPVKTLKPDKRFESRFDDEFDEKGRLKLRRIFGSDGNMQSIDHYSYNADGLIETRVHNSYGSKWSYTFSYDAGGNIKEKIMKRSDAENVVDLVNRSEYRDYKFDAQGNWIERRYTLHSESEGETTVTEAMEYRDITYHEAEKPKKAVLKKKKKN